MLSFLIRIKMTLALHDRSTDQSSSCMLVKFAQTGGIFSSVTHLDRSAQAESETLQNVEEASQISNPSASI